MSIRAFLGGSFNPVHLAHIQMAQKVFDTLQASNVSQNFYVSLLPTAGNPFKSLPIDAHHRLEMLKIATQGTKLHIDTHEIRQTPPVYTIDTIRHLKHLYPDDKLIFIIGQDNLANLPKWKDGYQLINHVNFWVFNRFDMHENTPITLCNFITQNLDDFLKGERQIYQDNTNITAMSSSQIRHYLQENNPLADDYLAPEVIKYIKTHALYR